jgi:hypothetical protein
MLVQRQLLATAQVDLPDTRQLVFEQDRVTDRMQLFHASSPSSGTNQICVVANRYAVAYRDFTRQLLQR